VQQIAGYTVVGALAPAVEAGRGSSTFLSPTVTLGLTAAVRPVERSVLQENRRSSACIPPLVGTKASYTVSA